MSCGKSFEREASTPRTHSHKPRVEHLHVFVGWVGYLKLAVRREQRRIRGLPLQSIYAVSQKHRRLAFPGGPELRVLERWNQLCQDERVVCEARSRKSNRVSASLLFPSEATLHVCAFLISKPTKSSSSST